MKLILSDTPLSVVDGTQDSGIKFIDLSALKIANCIDAGGHHLRKQLEETESAFAGCCGA